MTTKAPRPVASWPVEPLAEMASAIERCNRCGVCQAGCPIYKVTGIEWTTARGRISLLRGVLDGEIPLDRAELEEPLWNCLGCDGCSMHCPPGIRTDEIVEAGRTALARATGRPFSQRVVFGSLLPRPGLLGLSVRAASLAQRMGLMPLGAKIGQAVLGGQFGQAVDSLPRLPSSTARERLRGLQPIANARLRVAYFLGCAVNLLYPEIAEATVRVLRRQGVDVVVPDVVCCGKPPATYGDRESAQALARRNVDSLGGLRVDAIVVDCPTCGSFLQKYPTLLAQDGPRAERAAGIAKQVRDISTFLLDIGMAGLTREFRHKVTYHDPCHLAHYQNVQAQPRKLLRSVPGVEFLEAPEAELCCGGAGTYSLRERDLSMRVLARKMANFASTGADVLVTQCPSCVLQLSSGVRQHDLPMKVMHTVQVLDQAYN